MSVKSAVLVAVQVAAIGGLVFTGPIFPQPWILQVLVVAGFAIIVSSLFMLRPRNLNVAPEVRSGGELITNGPYRFVRHPVYSGGVLVCLTWVIGDFTWLRLGALAILLVDLAIKIPYEEKFLLEAFSDYDQYRQRTKKLVPFLF